MRIFKQKIEQALAYLSSIKAEDKSTELKDIELLVTEIKEGAENELDFFENSIVDDLKYGIWSVSTDFTTMLYSNRSLASMLQVSLTDLKDNPKMLRELIHPEDINIYKKAQREFLDTGTSVAEYRMITAANNVLWIEVRELLIRSKKGSAVRIDGVIKNISTKKKIIENELKRGGDLLLHQEILFRLSCLGSEYSFEQKQHLLLENAAKVLDAEWLGVWMFNSTKTILKSKLRYCLSQNEFLDEKQLFSAEYPKYFERLKALKTEKSIVFDDVSQYDDLDKLRIEHLNKVDISSMLLLPITKDNHLLGVISISSVGEPRKWTQDEQSFAASLANILSIYFESEEKRIIGNALMEKTKVLLEAQHVAKIGNYIIDLQTGEWKSSIVFDQVFGIDRLTYKKDVRNWIKLISPEYSERVFNVFKEVIKQKTLNDKHRFEEMFKIIRQNDGEERWVSVIGEFQYDSEGHPTHMLGTMQDITVRKLIEFELVQSKNLAEELLKTKANFLSNMSHEIRTPLNGIIGFTNLLKDSNLDEDQREMVGAIEFSGKNLLVIVNDILDFSKMEANKMVFEMIPFDILETLRNTLHLMVLKAQEKGVELIYGIDDHISKKLIGDPTRLNQVLNNLVGNAVKFTEEGFVELNLKLIESNNESELIEFSIIDSGIGIEQDKLQLIFESFSQASNNTTRIFGGSGLGLAITKRLIEQQNGKLQVESVLGKGSVFFFQLWFEKQENQDAEVHSLDELKIGTSFLIGKKILMAEDIEINRKLIKRIFEKWSCDIDLAVDGLKALEMAKENYYDLILMDLQMPIMSGIDSATEILKFTEVPIIALSAYTSIEDEKRCLDAGLKALITKPINQEVLLQYLFKYIVEESIEVKVADKPTQFKSEEKLINLNYLNTVTNGDEDFKKEMIDLVTAQLPKFVKSIKQLVLDDKPDLLKREIHKLKSCIGIIGLEKGKVLINEMETEISISNSINAVRSKVKALLEMIYRLEEELKAY